MLVAGAITATWPARVMKTPAEVADAPRGETNTITGSRAFWMSLTMSSVELTRPPGVSSSITIASAPARVASPMASWR